MKAFITLSCLAVIIGTASALKCFKCNSATDASCTDPFEADSGALRGSFLKECEPLTVEGEAAPLPAIYCKKVHMWLGFTGEYRVDRDCGYQKREIEGPCYQTRADDHIVDTCQCAEDGCNGASSTAPGLALALVLLGYLLQ